MSNVAFMIGDENHQIANHLSREFAQGFCEIGYESTFITASEIKSADQFHKTLKDDDVKLIISMSGIGLDMRAEGNIYNQANIPLLSMYLDQPIHYWDRVNAPIKDNVITCLSTNDAKYVERYAHPKRKSFQLAHAANPKEVLDWDKKDIPLFYCGTLRQMPDAQRAAWSGFGENVAKKLNEIVESHLGNGAQNLMQTCLDHLEDETDCSNPMNIHPYYVTIDGYLRDFHRVETLKQFQNMPVLLAGGGWDAVVEKIENPNLKYLGRIHPDDVRTYNEHSKMVLNVINTFHESHERVFSSMADGSVSVSSTSAFYKESFDENDLVLFDWVDTNLEEKCLALLNDDQALEEMADKGHDRFKKNHTWKNRAEKVASELKLN